MGTERGGEVGAILKVGLHPGGVKVRQHMPWESSAKACATQAVHAPWAEPPPRSCPPLPRTV